MTRNPLRGVEEPGPQPLSADGKRVAYTAELDQQWTVVADGQPGTEYGGIERLTFSPDGRHRASLSGVGVKKAGDPGKFVVLDGRAGPKYSDVYGGFLGFGVDGSLEFYAERWDEDRKQGSLYRVRYIPTP